MLLSKQAELGAHTQMFASNHMQPASQSSVICLSLHGARLSSCLVFLSVPACPWVSGTAAWQLPQAPTPTLTTLVSRVLTRRSPWY